MFFCREVACQPANLSSASASPLSVVVHPEYQVDLNALRSSPGRWPGHQGVETIHESNHTPLLGNRDLYEIDIKKTSIRSTRGLIPRVIPPPQQPGANPLRRPPERPHWSGSLSALRPGLAAGDRFETDRLPSPTPTHSPALFLRKRTPTKQWPCCPDRCRPSHLSLTSCANFRTIFLVT
jgi:hypothetical protein